MKDTITPLFAIAIATLFSCTNQEVECLENKQVVIKSITPSARICKITDETFRVEHEWDTTQTIVLSECDAQQYIEDLENSWEMLMNEHKDNANLSEQDSLYYDFFSNNPPSFTISDDEN